MIMLYIVFKKGPKVFSTYPLHNRKILTFWLKIFELFWNPFIIYLSKTAIKQSNSSIYAAFVDLPVISVCTVSVTTVLA